MDFVCDCVPLKAAHQREIMMKEDCIVNSWKWMALDGIVLEYCDFRFWERDDDNLG